MTAVEMWEVLGDRIKISLREDLSPEERQTENEQTKLIINASKQAINAGNLILNAEKLMAQNKDLNVSVLKKVIGE